MGKPRYNIGKNAKEKARQQKQMDKAAKRQLAKQNKANVKVSKTSEYSDTAEPSRGEEITQNTA